MNSEDIKEALLGLQIMIAVICVMFFMTTCMKVYKKGYPPACEEVSSVQP